jgi:hypothetical protein
MAAGSWHYSLATRSALMPPSPRRRAIAAGWGGGGSGILEGEDPSCRAAPRAATALASLDGLLAKRWIRLPPPPAMRLRLNSASCASHHLRSSTRLRQ